jgi:hypothetical protein
LYELHCICIILTDRMPLSYTMTFLKWYNIAAAKTNGVKTRKILTAFGLVAKL